MDTNKIYGLEFEGIDHRDYPDYCDAFISAGQIDDRDLTDEELDVLNDDSCFKLTKLMDYLN
jgi:hypothetical protein